MKIVIFKHPAFLEFKSMERYADWLSQGLQDRGHKVVLLEPASFFSKLASSGTLRKWLGYLDQYILFPLQVSKKIQHMDKETLFVFSDHALGPWVPLVLNREHIIHCHDFLAQRSALGEIEENATSWSGKIYQKYIRRGYAQGRNFICISEKTKTDLITILPANQKKNIQVIYNGVNPRFKPFDSTESRATVGREINADLGEGYFLHVGGNMWYKNRIGVIRSYIAWRQRYQPNTSIPLLMVGQEPTEDLLHLKDSTAYGKQIYFLSAISDEKLPAIYAGSIGFVFPSLAEGFGWPIAEAMASGCPVITTDEAPMNEVAGDAAFYVARQPLDKVGHEKWLVSASDQMQHLVTMSEEERQKVKTRSLKQAGKFKSHEALDKIEAAYLQLLGKGSNALTLPDTEEVSSKFNRR